MQFHPGIFTRVSFQRFSRKKKDNNQQKKQLPNFIFSTLEKETENAINHFREKKNMQGFN